MQVRNRSSRRKTICACTTSSRRSATEPPSPTRRLTSSSPATWRATSPTIRRPPCSWPSSSRAWMRGRPPISPWRWRARAICSTSPRFPASRSTSTQRAGWATRPRSSWSRSSLRSACPWPRSPVEDSATQAAPSTRWSRFPGSMSPRAASASSRSRARREASWSASRAISTPPTRSSTPCAT